MTNRFDFELRADDKVSDALKEIDERVRGLQPELDKTNDGLKLGGQETREGLSDVNQAFSTLGRFAKNNVQFIGDMVPPLRNFTGMAGKMGGMAGKLGLAGGAAYLAGKGVHALASNMSEAADDAYGLQLAAENAGMGVKDFTQLSGAMRLLGSDSENARGSVEGLYKTFNDALQGRNSAALAVMNQVHAKIVRNADGTANVLGTVQSLAEVFPKLSPQNQKTVADALGLDANSLQLLREGVRLKTLLSKADRVGLTVDPKVNQQLVGLNRTLADLSASWDGFKQRSQQKFAGALLSDGSVNDGFSGISDVLEHGINPISVSHALGFNRGNDADMMRRAKNDKEFLATLDPYQKNRLKAGFMLEQDREKYQLRYGLGDRASQLLADTAAINEPQALPVPNSQPVNPSALSVRNNNPWNIRYAKQAGAVPGDGDFARFDSPEAGVKAAERQLMLYYSGKSVNVDHPLRTLSEIVNTASPAKDHNNTPLMIQNASRELGVQPDQPLNLDDPDIRSRFLAAVFNQEGNNPFSASQIRSIIQPQTENPQALAASPPLVAPPLLPTASVPAAPQPAADPQALSRALSDAFREQGLKVELTLIDAKTGKRQTVTGSGSRVSTAMQFP